MENSNESGNKKLEKFFAGKGFYIVLFLCAAVIGVSVWTLASGKGTVEEAVNSDITMEEPYQENEDTSLDNADTPDDYESAMWEVPEGAEEVLAEPEAPDTASEAASVPETNSEPVSSFIWPVIGTVEMPYSVTTLEYDVTMGDWRTHDGMDIAAPLGGQVMAAASGTVEQVYDDEMYGTTVVIDHGSGLKSIYSNLAEVPTVKAGDVILGGETIGSVGDTALCEAGEVTHLHFAMRLNGESVDPNNYLPAL